MPLETASYITDLNSANPAHTDQINQDDSHMRLVKSTLKATFPNFTSAPLNSSQAQIDSLTTNGTAVLADAGVNFKTNTGDGFTNPAAGEVDVKAASSLFKHKSDGSLTVPGAVIAGSLSATPGTFPLAGSMPWFSDTLPSGTGTWAWLNGQTISRTTYAAVFAILGTTYGVGDGSTTFGLPDTRDNILVGKGTMGSTTAVGRITNFVTSAIGNMFGECLHLLGIGEVPAHSHTITDVQHTHTVANTNSGGGALGYTGGASTISNVTTTSAAFTGITGTNNAGGGTTHNNVQPSLVCNWIMRIA
jgi:microcystin-dependent protein